MRGNPPSGLSASSSRHKPVTNAVSVVLKCSLQLLNVSCSRVLLFVPLPLHPHLTHCRSLHKRNHGIL